MPFPVNIIGSWAIWDKLAGNNDDDWVDRLNHIYTVVILIVFAVFVAGESYVGDPISCWHPTEHSVFDVAWWSDNEQNTFLLHEVKDLVYGHNAFNNYQYIGSHRVKYANSYCWIQNTYYVPMSESIPKDSNTRVHLEITYYQYVPLILLFMAFLFKLPCLLWRNFSGYSGIDLPRLVEMTKQAHYIEDNKRLEKISAIGMLVDRWLEANRQYHWNILVRLRQKVSRVCFCMNRREGTYLTGLYMFVKILFTVNVVGQFFILDAFLDGFFSLWGIEALYSLAHEYAIKESRRFPRVTLCDFNIRQLENVHRHTVQCVLPINLFNEKIFLFLWFWFVLVSVITCSNVLFWFWRTLFQRNRTCFVKKYLIVSSRIHTSMDKKLCKKFAAYLRDDGIFLIRMVQKNSNEILVTDLIARLWDIFLEKPIVKKMMIASNGGDNGNNNTRRATAPPAKENYI